MDNPQKSLETARQRFNQLASALRTFNDVLHHGPPDALPAWTTLQSHFNVLSSTLDSLSHTLTTHFPPATTTPTALVSYPLPSFPAPTQSILLSMLCNKKPNAAVADWHHAALHDAAVGALTPADRRAQDDFWAAVYDVVQEQQVERSWYDDLYTAEEREAGVESVVTGLEMAGGVPVRRGEGELGAKAGVVPGALRLEAMLRFMETGVAPRDQAPLPSGVVGLKR
ncbi:mediator of RNA polymerase II transcription complex subunit 8-domain-containing protein [Morchella snyderi]|nr:mediator of RNA polymerase II transcription complex subunit 8-domain-containing protein [Morchella snyderi]